VGTTRADERRTHGSAIWFPLLVAVVARPRLWPTALRQLRRTIPARWWRHRPFLPLPDANYLRYRVETAYGTMGAPTARDVEAYLAWCRTSDRSLRAGRARHLRRL
jgi:hypothetical protein